MKWSYKQKWLRTELSQAGLNKENQGKTWAFRGYRKQDSGRTWWERTRGAVPGTARLGPWCPALGKPAPGKDPEAIPPSWGTPGTTKSNVGSREVGDGATATMFPAATSYTSGWSSDPAWGGTGLRATALRVLHGAPPLRDGSAPALVPQLPCLQQSLLPTEAQLG